jgi:tetratricopeptide (TPR) repeat protein
LRKAASTTRRAAELYPNNSMIHAQLAWLYHLVGDSREAAAEAEEALRLDAQNPHEEQKLAKQQVFHPPKIEGVHYHQEPPPEENAEQLIERLRTIEGTGDNP